MAYKTLNKIDAGIVKLIKAAAKYPNVCAISKRISKNNGFGNWWRD
ncbi:hypothetical protein [Spiroplasma endosymbiont of Polydrusus pterygomalis]